MWVEGVWGDGGMRVVRRVRVRVVRKGELLSGFWRGVGGLEVGKLKLGLWAVGFGLWVVEGGRSKVQFSERWRSVSEEGERRGWVV